ncbi:MAG: PspC domain-containing protein [Bacteroidales bacterium]
MKKVISVGLGGRSFTIDEDAYDKLNSYLEMFRKKLGKDSNNHEIMEDIENRVSELFSENLSFSQQVVDIALVNKVISVLGLPDGSNPENEFYVDYDNRPVRKLYRDSDHRVLGGVCSGLAYYLDADILVIRIITIILIMLGSIGFWVYLIIWFIVPVAYTAVEKCEMRGIPVTAENIRKFSNYKR